MVSVGAAKRSSQVASASSKMRAQRASMDCSSGSAFVGPRAKPGSPHADAAATTRDATSDISRCRDFYKRLPAAYQLRKSIATGDDNTSARSPSRRPRLSPSEFASTTKLTCWSGSFTINDELSGD